jgi:hypothetical protein
MQRATRGRQHATYNMQLVTRSRQYMQRTTCSKQRAAHSRSRQNCREPAMLRDINIATIERQKDTACGSGEESLDTSTTAR